MDVEHLDVVLGARIGGLERGLALADRRVAGTAMRFRALERASLMTSGSVNTLGLNAARSARGVLAAEEAHRRGIPTVVRYGRAHEEAGKKVGKAEGLFRRFHKGRESVTGALGREGRGALKGTGLMSMGTFASGGFISGAAAGLVGSASVRAAISFQDEMELLHTQAGATTGEVERMTAAVKRMAIGLGTSPAELAKGLFFVESAGFRGTKALKMLTIAAKGAKVGHADLESTSRAFVAAQVSGIRGVGSGTKAMGTMNAIVGAGAMRFPELLGAFGTGLLSKAATFGLSIQEVGAALAVMTHAGIGAQKAGTQLGMMFHVLGAPTAAATKALKVIGLTATQMGDSMRNRGLIPTLRLLKTHLEASGLTATQQGIVLTRAIGGGRTAGAIETLLKQLKRVPRVFHEITASADTFGEKWAKTQKTAKFSMDRFHSSVQLLEITLGNALIPLLAKLANQFSNWVAHAQKTGQLTRIMHQVASAVRQAAAAASYLAGMANRVAHAVGGWKNMLKLLIALKLASVLFKWTGGMRSFQLATGRAGGGVGMLATRLGAAGLVLQAGLAAFAITTLILKLTHLDKLLRTGGSHAQSWLSKHIPGANQAMSALGIGSPRIPKNAPSSMFQRALAFAKSYEAAHPSKYRPYTDKSGATVVSAQYDALSKRLHKMFPALDQYTDIPQIIEAKAASLRAARRAAADVGRGADIGNTGAVAPAKKSAAAKAAAAHKAALKAAAAAVVADPTAETLAAFDALMGGGKGKGTTKTATKKHKPTPKIKLPPILPTRLEDAIERAKILRVNHPLAGERAELGAAEKALTFLNSEHATGKRLLELDRKRKQMTELIAELHKQISKQLEKQHRLASNYKPVHSTDLVKGLGLNRAQKIALEQRYAQAMGHGGKLPTGMTVAGVAVGGQGGHTTNVGGITVHVHGHAHRQTAKEIAREVQAELLRHGGRNPSQSRG